MMSGLIEEFTGMGSDSFPMLENMQKDSARLLAAARAHDILEKMPLNALDRVSEMAADIFDAPIAAVRVADSDRIWCRSPAAIGKKHRNGSSPDVSGFVRPSAKVWRLTGNRDRLSLTMPMVAIEQGLRFYASVPLTTSEGQDVGKLCVLDREYRPVSQSQARQLKALAAIAMEQITLQLSVLSAVDHAKTLAGEVDHRVMNSLQFVAGLLNMQSRSVRTTEAAAQLALAANRITAVARVHQLFAVNDVAKDVPVLAYLHRLSDELSTILDVPIEVTGSEASIPSSQILAIGFSVNEFIVNAKKHGAPPIKVCFAPNSAGHHQISVMDDGEGLPEGFAVGQHNRGDGLGMRIVAALTAQLAGKLSIGANPDGRGACFTITFPKA